MVQREDENLLSEMDAIISDTTADDDALPFESLDDFSTEPVEFSEMAARMLAKVETVFDLTAVYNRHSQYYMRACALLEKGIKFLGRACVTKKALEAYNNSFPELSQLTTQKLYRMVSFNYRKLDAALSEKLEKQGDLYPQLMDMEFRYFNLLQRLRSTETKIYRYFIKKYYEEEDYNPVVDGLSYSEKSWAKSYTSQKEEAPAFHRAPAFPMLSQLPVAGSRLPDTAKQLPVAGSRLTAAVDQLPAVGSRLPVADEQLPAAGSQLPAEGDQESVNEGIHTIPGQNSKGVITQNSYNYSSHNAAFQNTPDSSSMTTKDKTTPESYYRDEEGNLHVNVAAYRRQKIAEAQAAGNHHLALEIAKEAPQRLYERLCSEYPQHSPGPPARSGPSDERRKKLREKRKKKK